MADSRFSPEIVKRFKQYMDTLSADFPTPKQASVAGKVDPRQYPPLGNHGRASQQALGAGTPVAAPEPTVRLKPSNQRFRSFAERYLLTRAEHFRQDPEGLEADTWECIQDARRAYSMIKNVGRGVDDSEDKF